MIHCVSEGCSRELIGTSLRGCSVKVRLLPAPVRAPRSLLSVRLSGQTALFKVFFSKTFNGCKIFFTICSWDLGIGESEYLFFYFLQGWAVTEAPQTINHFKPERKCFAKLSKV